MTKDSKKSQKAKDSKKSQKAKSSKKPQKAESSFDEKHKILSHILIGLLASGGVGLGVAAYHNKNKIPEMIEKIKEKDLYSIVKKILNKASV